MSLRKAVYSKKVWLYSYKLHIFAVFIICDLLLKIALV